MNRKYLAVTIIAAMLFQVTYCGLPTHRVARQSGDWQEIIRDYWNRITSSGESSSNKENNSEPTIKNNDLGVKDEEAVSATSESKISAMADEGVEQNMDMDLDEFRQFSNTSEFENFAYQY
ncbi:uncharacterized protein LOC126846794 [Adelges cooleyi]|uniref:uncharacterized protein LOC126846794 n=1 Tax=Adelges cooleyi TaxID=133065 RepID=UPI0021802BF4|nr:uncharacterized protein LOC126846794 [Adelges cooleyi]